MRLLPSACRDETLQLNMQTCQSECPTMHTRREWLPVAARPRHAAVPPHAPRIASHCIALPPPRSWSWKSGRPHDSPAATAQDKRPPSPSQPTWIPQHKPQSPEARSRVLGETHTVWKLCHSSSWPVLELWPPPCPIRCSPPPRPVRKRLSLVIGQFTIDVASAQAGLSHAQTSTQASASQIARCAHISGYTLASAWYM